MQLPPSFNLPKSQLHCYGESIYCTASDLLTECGRGGTPMQRFLSVVAWSVSMIRPLEFGVAPYNPILGETHHVSRNSLNVVVEQVCHHPPVTALHATDEKEGVEIIWCQSPLPKFYGTHIETEMRGKINLKLRNAKETYQIDSPNLVIRFLPAPSVDWIGNVSIKCRESGLEARISYGSNSFFRLPSSYRSVRGKILASSRTVYEVKGHWDRIVTVTDAVGKRTVIYDAKTSISNLKTPVVTDKKESTVVWGEVSRGILEKNWSRAREAKAAIEEKQRREMGGMEWRPKYFTFTPSDDNPWECSPILPNVPPAPITIE
ncbi:oxysterol-binding protein [Genlisea aurea]|uniref:Oxysterol-binding protein n=1 Tax=Genlisea aurea TaxID=192259 RepID=S8E9E4_9LAMI|nr:oxysterol-binding protein [Genlisea aurea]